MKHLFLKLVFLTLFSSAVFGQVSVTIPNITGQPNSQTTANIMVSSLTGYNVTSFQFEINYNKAVVYITGITTTGTLTAGNSPQFLADTAGGRIRVAWASATPLSGSGALLGLTVKFRNSGATSLTFSTSFPFIFNTGNPTANLTNGSATVSTVVNNPPVFNTIPAQTAYVGAELKFTVSAVDPEGQPVTLGSGALPSGATFNASTGQFSWTPAANQVGSHTANFTASDGVNTANLTVNITVSSNKAPLFNAIGSQSTFEGMNITFTVSASDPEGQPITLRVGTLPQGAEFNTSTGVFSWTPNYNQAGNYIVSFFASDGAAEAKLDVPIEVSNLNGPPEINAIPPKSVMEGVSIYFEVVAVDPDGDAITYSVENLPNGAQFDAQTHYFAWIPGYDQSGVYNVKFNAKDPFNNTATLTVQITVVNVNRPPEFKTVMPPQTVQVHNVTVEFTFDYSALDPDNDPLLFTLEKGPEGSEISASGKFRWMVPPSAAGKQYQVVVKVSDNIASVTHTTTLTGSNDVVSVEDTEEMPREYKLFQNYPNPFNPETTITFTIPEGVHVSLKVFDLLGKEVATLVNSRLAAGSYNYKFDAKNLRSGVYFYQLRAGSFVELRKMSYLK